ncbi:MAG: hypothetical protein LBL19_04405 [Spirochaetaceae bacterium]|jgi:hypothetical protein|nr:hypothetical protein [Spirochaetaceae bacterium]
MKRNLLVLILMLPVTALFAQTGDPRFERRRVLPADPPATVTVNGNLAFINGGFGLKSGDITYYVIGIDRLIGFVDGLTEGAQVTLEGYEFPDAAAQEYRYLRAFKLNFNGKDYEVSPRLRQFAEGENFSQPFAGPRPRGYPGHSGPMGPRRNFRHHFEWQ